MVKTFLSTIWAWALKNRLFLIAILGCIILFKTNQYNYNKAREERRKAEIAVLNLSAAYDSVRVTRDAINKDEFNRKARYATMMSELEEMSKGLTQEIKNIRGDVKSIQMGSVVVKRDTIVLPASVLVDTALRTITLTSETDTTYSVGNYNKIKFQHTYNNTTGVATGKLLQNETGITLTTGIKDINGHYEIFFKSPYPGLVVTALDGAVIDKNLFSTKETPKRPLLTGPRLNLSYTPVTYDFLHNKFDFNPMRLGMGIGISLNLNRR